MSKKNVPTQGDQVTQANIKRMNIEKVFFPKTVTLELQNGPGKNKPDNQDAAKKVICELLHAH